MFLFPGLLLAKFFSKKRRKERREEARKEKGKHKKAGLIKTTKFRRY